MSACVLVGVAMLGAAPSPNHAYFAAQVAAARWNMGVAESIMVEPCIGEIRLQLPGEKKPLKRVAYVQAVGRDFMLIYDAGWLAKASEREARWVGFHEVAHVALDAPMLRSGIATKKERLAMEARACDAADKWIEFLDKAAGKKPGRRRWLSTAAAILF